MSAIPALNVEICHEIVGYGDADFQNRKIAYDTPIGKALMGLGKCGTRDAKLPRGYVLMTVEALFESWPGPEEQCEILISKCAMFLETWAIQNSL